MAASGTGPAGEADEVSAAVLVIGDEILSGRTKDRNIGHIAEVLTGMGIDLREVRVVPDVEAEIVAALNALRARYTYVFTTGGIGPTHDDITADSVAAAFDVPIDVDPRAVEMMRQRYSEDDLTPSRLRMARIPDGAELIDNPVSFAPGFMLENVIVLAGVPKIMQAMLDVVAPRLEGGTPMLSQTRTVPTREGDIADALAAVQAAHGDTIIGSYPGYSDEAGYFTSIVVRARDAGKLDAAIAAVEGMIARHGLSSE